MYQEIENGIYEYKKENEVLYVTSLSFIQEPEYGEGVSAEEISRYPLEDILDKFYCCVSDFYEEMNAADSKVCYLEFSTADMDDIKRLRSIIGKHVYNKEYKENGETFVKLVIE